MSLKDRLTDALTATPPENTHRRDILTAALSAGENDAAIAAALDRLIEAREQKAVQLEKNGQAPQAEAERAEARALRLLADPNFVAAPTAKAAAGGKAKGPLFTRLQIILGVVALAAVAVLAIVYLRPTEETPQVQPITVFKDDHTLGNPNAPVKLVEYAAPMCPHCARFATEEFPAFKREFIDSGRVFYIFRVYPLGQPDGAVEGVARCLPPNRYFPYMEMMFREQSQWDPDGNQIPDVEAAIAKLATREGLSEEKAKACMRDPANADHVNQVTQDAMVHYQIEGTPTFVLNGEVVNLPAGKEPGEILRLRINSLGSGQ